jgi:hypothetical protein
MEIPKDIKDQVWDYCRVNNITNVDQFMLDCLKQGFTVEKYGTSPIVPQVIEKEVEKIVEKIVEVPVEKIVEKVVEVPVEKIVEKIITNDTQVQELLVKIGYLENELKSEKEKTSNSELGKLYQQINNLENLLKVERNRNAGRKENENPFGDKPRNVINWVPKENRGDNLYNE